MVTSYIYLFVLLIGLYLDQRSSQSVMTKSNRKGKTQLTFLLTNPTCYPAEPQPRGADVWLSSLKKRARREQSFLFANTSSRWAPSRTDWACFAPRQTTQRSREPFSVKRGMASRTLHLTFTLLVEIFSQTQYTFLCFHTNTCSTDTELEWFHMCFRHWFMLKEFP